MGNSKCGVDRNVHLMRRFCIVISVVVAAAACGGDDEGGGEGETTLPGAGTTTTASTTTTSAAATSTTSAGASVTTTTTVAATTTFTTEAYGFDPDDADSTGSGEATFVISEVVFGGEGYVAVTNVGGESADLEGWQLCQRPSYFGIPSVEVAPGETVFFTAGEGAGLSGTTVRGGPRFGRLSDSSGEMGLYRDSSFGSAGSIASYVEWGSSGHGRSSVAVEAGIWSEGEFVASEGALGLVANAEVPTRAADWTPS